ncbi:MAG: transglutaminase-like domain-containing protein [Planctomycetota bacterium]|nr:transglutaminase-like domain-containing protein [Planctomycetota bacterium]
MGLFRFNRLALLSILTCLTLGLAGCSPETTGYSAPAAAPVAKPDVDLSTAISVQGQPRETWDAFYLHGTKVGYARTTFRDIEVDGEPGVQVDSTNTVVVNRSGQQSAHTITSTGIETLLGALVRFQTTLQSGSSETEFKGEVVGDQLSIATGTSGKSTTTNVPWPAAAGGFLALEQSLLRQPIQPGERRTLTGLMTVVNQPVVMELTAGTTETTRLLDHSEDLLRVDCNAKLPTGSTITERLWVNRDGVIMKRQINALNQEIYRTTKELALADVGPARFDLMLDTTVPVNRPLAKPHQTRKIRYRVQLQANDPTQVFATSATQQVQLLDNRTAELIVTASSLNSPKPETTAAAPGTVSTATVAPPVSQTPQEQDSQPNNLIQSDYPKIVAMAKQAAGSETDPAKVAALLEQCVHRHLQRPNFSQTFATAAETADSGEGDCTEHSVLLAALCRAKGIPARVVIGLVYASTSQGFGYHMWNEVWIDGRWVPLDATLAQGGIGAAHIKLADSNLHGTTAFSTFLSVSQVIGQLKIEIVEVE